MPRIELLGGFRVVTDHGPVGAWRHRRAAELVKLLALAPRHRLHREHVMDALWPDLPAEGAAANLRKAMHFARRVLGSDAAIGTDEQMISLWPDIEVEVDAEEFERDARKALGTDDPAACERAAEQYGGELLPEDRYAAWAEEPRDRLHLRFVEVLRRAGAWERVLEVDPADEEALQALMQAALRAGNRREVIGRFEQLRERLRLDLGLGPDPRSITLYEQALAMEGVEPPSVAQRASALLAQGLVHLNGGELDDAERTAEEARSLAIDAGLGREMGEASALLGMVANMQGRWRDLFRSEFVASVRRAPELAAYVFDAHLCLAEFCLCGRGGHEEIAGYARELLEVAEEAGSTQGRALATLVLGEAELFSGNLGPAEESLSAAEKLHAEADAAGGRALAIQRLAETALARGQRWNAARLLRRGLRLAELNWLAPHLLVRFHGALVQAAPDSARALEAVRRGEDALAGRATCPPCSMGFRVASTIARARAGQLDQAQQELDGAERLAGMWQGGPWEAAVWEARGELRLAQGDEQQARALFKEAAERFEGLGRPPDAERCRARGAG
ncbi:MAG TPA: BTAD domain-containing putative transcriptional regulator [Actinomycetota bacterium]